MYEIDHLLFGNQEWIPVILPESVISLQKQIKVKSPKKKKERGDVDEILEKLEEREANLEETLKLNTIAPKLKKKNSEQNLAK